MSTVIYILGGRRILSGSAEKSSYATQQLAKSSLDSLPLIQTPFDLSVSIYQAKTFITGSSDKTITIWNAKTFQPIRKNPGAHSDWVISVRYSPDGGFILSASVDGTLRVWDGKKGRVVSKSVENGCGICTTTFSRG